MVENKMIQDQTTTNGIPFNYSIIWDLKALYIIHSECGQRIEVNHFDKGFRTPPKEYQEDVQQAIVMHKCPELMKK